MAKKKAIKRIGRGRYELDVLQLKQDIANGSLSAQDRRIAEQILPGVCDRVSAMQSTDPTPQVEPKP